MSARRHRLIVARLLAGTAAAADPAAAERDELMRTAARIAWLRRICDQWRDAIKAADAAWMKLVEPYADRDEDEEIPDLPPPPERAEVDRLWQLLEDVRRHDRWPLHLHWTL
ncbi:MAG: hypothetical protein QOG13_2995 [Sphingomonadales bacterium]|jgi:hypothetical protein|nr:hypothetical protein [Sphingomonadales bacterium]